MARGGGLKLVCVAVANLYLTAVHGPQAGLSHTFEQPGHFVIGRAPDCDLVLPADSAGVSRHHARLEVDPPHAKLVDLRSTNGTWVNSLRLHHTSHVELSLATEDKIGIGETAFQLYVEAPLGTQRRLRCSECGLSELLDHSPLGPHVCGDCLGTQVESEAQRFRRLDELAKEIDGYQVGRRLGAGGMGTVYAGIRDRDGMPVALKVMRSQLFAEQKHRADFLREMRVAGGLEHPNLVRCIDGGESATSLWLALEYCAGGSLHQVLRARDTRLTPQEAISLFDDVLEGLGFMHDLGYVHRDIKPQNILLHQGRARLADFGLAKSFEKAGLTAQLITRTGQDVRGTPSFTPREQVINFKYVKPVSDVWSAAASMYYGLTGTFPRNKIKGRQRMLVALIGQLVPIRQREARVPAPLAELIDRALSPHPEERPQDARAFQAALRALKL